ncbi:hypothetical protein [Brevundimonas naejangsanensis]|uniref:hypothetical protein n=1 Tax=Brevundimonas naejangsanensis TaxID=588932 RepID=UPI0012DC802E|nr:hypothetical protein [Brevundimonas naejangsanensis]
MAFPKDQQRSLTRLYRWLAPLSGRIEQLPDAGNETVVALPSTLGAPGQVLAVNAAGDGLEWVTP